MLVHLRNAFAKIRSASSAPTFVLPLVFHALQLVPVSTDAMASRTLFELRFERVDLRSDHRVVSFVFGDQGVCELAARDEKRHAVWRMVADRRAQYGASAPKNSAPLIPET
jgi:hypothetical protein